MRVLRWQLGVVDHQVLAVPAPGRVLSVAASRSIANYGLDLWTIADETTERVTYDVYVVGTGNPMPAALTGVRLVLESNFVGTVVTPGGLVWHVWAVGR